jgi:hypothetical protein
MHDLRFAAACWWLSQRVDFLDWRWHFDALMPQPQPMPAPVQAQHSGRCAVHSL